MYRGEQGALSPATASVGVWSGAAYARKAATVCAREALALGFFHCFFCIRGARVVSLWRCAVSRVNAAAAHRGREGLTAQAGPESVSNEIEFYLS